MSVSIREEIIARADEIRAVLSGCSASYPRLFGSVARGDDGPDSDVDLLVDAGGGCSLLDLCRAEIELERRFGREFDVVTIAGLHPSIRPAALAQAVAL